MKISKVKSEMKEVGAIAKEWKEEGVGGTGGWWYHKDSVLLFLEIERISFKSKSLLALLEVQLAALHALVQISYSVWWHRLDRCLKVLGFALLIGIACIQWLCCIQIYCILLQR